MSRRDAFLRLALAGEQHDPDARAHLLRIERLTSRLCRTLCLDPAETEEIALASLLHDAGKALLPLSLQRTSGRFTAEERARQREHTLAGESMLAGPAQYATARAVARHHHERWDGSGYPDGLVETAIPLAARIVAVADVFDALTTPRGHRRAWPAEEAIAYIGDHAGIHYDPEVAAALLAVWRSGELDRTV